MRRQFLIVTAALLLVGAIGAFADEAVLIDFSLLKADIIQDPVNEGKFLQNRQTMIDFAATAGASYTEEQKKQMRTSLAIPNWSVTLASSSRSSVTVPNSYTREAVDPRMPSSTRKRPFWASASISPSSPSIPGLASPRLSRSPPSSRRLISRTTAPSLPRTGASDDPVNARLTRFEGTYNAETKIQTALGVVKNVGVIKSVAVTVKGLNFPHGLSLILKDQDANEQVIFMGYLNFDGWRELRWDNPQYVKDVRNRELRVYPLYPKTSPFVKFGGFVISRDAAHEGGDFVAYLKDVKVLYDKAITRPRHGHRRRGHLGHRRDEGSRAQALREPSLREFPGSPLHREPEAGRQDRVYAFQVGSERIPKRAACNAALFFCLFLVPGYDET